MKFIIDEVSFAQFDYLCDNAFIFDDYINNLVLALCMAMIIGALFQTFYEFTN